MIAPDVSDHFNQVFGLAVKVKAAMKRQNRRRGWTKCPYCGGKVVVVLAGRRDHLHMACQTAGCNMRMME